MKKVLGILGGMGPAATADLFAKVTAMTKAGSDGEHLRVIIDSNAAIPDRTAAILSGGEDPLPQMLSALQNLERCGAQCVIMPCNTAHFYLPRLRERTDVPILDMLSIAAERCAKMYPRRKAAVLATRGTLATGLYDRAMETAGVPYLLPEEAERDILMHLIYDVV